MCIFTSNKTMDQTSALILAGALFIIMLGMGLSLIPDDFRNIFVHPKAVLLGLANQLIVLPLIGFGLISVLDLPPEIAVGLMILAACPGGPTSNLISHLAKGDLALSVSLTAASSLITIITIPFLINFSLEMILSEGEMIQLNVPETIVKILAIIVIPTGIGMALRHYRTAFADRMARPVRIASGVVLTLVILGIILKEKDNFISYFEQAGIAALLLNVIGMFIGFYSAKWLGVGVRQATSISIESGIQNGTLAIAIAATMLNNEAYAITPAVYSLIMFATGGVVIYWGIRRSISAD